MFGGRIVPNLNSLGGQIIGSTDKAPQRIYNYIGGVQFKNNSVEKKCKPFARALFGVSRQSSLYPDSSDARIRSLYFPNGGNKIKGSGFTMAFGSGLDIRVSRRFDLRVIQFDYNPVYLKSKTITVSDPANFVVSATTDIGVYRKGDPYFRKQNNYRIGFEIVFH